MILENRAHFSGSCPNGRRGVIRTPDPRLRKPMLCSAELRDASWCTREDSNPGPGRYERLALTAELQVRIGLAGRIRTCDLFRPREERYRAALQPVGRMGL